MDEKPGISFAFISRVTFELFIPIVFEGMKPEMSHFSPQSILNSRCHSQRFPSCVLVDSLALREINYRTILINSRSCDEITDLQIARQPTFQSILGVLGGKGCLQTFHGTVMYYTLTRYIKPFSKSHAAHSTPPFRQTSQPY